MNAVVTDWPSGSANTGWPQEPSAMLMPGRVQGWPAGTQRAANAAQRLLSQAVAWWDVEQYRDGDRFLRNRGTGGELLDLRLGSSIVANSNDPLYLPVDPQGSGYVYLSGVAGNSLSMTAPATATQYIAYPLDRSASTSTGSVTGGATFTFSTTGSWLKIELLDSSNVVLDTIDCDAITSGSNTSFLSVGNQTVTVNRSTSGRKSVCVPSRHKGGRPVMLLGSDDFLECVDNWQHQLLNFDTGQSFTALVVGRLWNTPTNNGVWLSKRSYLGSNIAGYALNQSGATLTGAFVASTGSFVLSNLTAGATTMLAGVDRRDSPAVLLYVNATPASGTGLTARSSWNSVPLRIGRRSDDTSYLDCEFYGAAIFRRALSPTEIKTLSDYFTGRIA